MAHVGQINSLSPKKKLFTNQEEYNYSTIIFNLQPHIFLLSSNVPIKFEI